MTKKRWGVGSLGRLPFLGAAVLGTSTFAIAGDGLAAPAADAVWPQWQARITVRSPSSASLLHGPLLAGSRDSGVLASGSVLGDHYFGSQGLSSRFRASGGLLLGLGGSGGSDMRRGGLDKRSDAVSAMAISFIGHASVQTGPASPAMPGLADRVSGDGFWVTPYLGLGYSGPIWHSSLSLSADLGVVAERVDDSRRNRGLLGSQSLDGAVRALRVSPVFQVGVRYAF